jgi:hypothetical protein
VETAGLTAADLLGLILKERSKEVDVVPPGFLRIEGWAKEWGIERTRAQQLLVYAVEKGVMECQTFRVICGVKRCPVKHFRQKKV